MPKSKPPAVPKQWMCDEPGCGLSFGRRGHLKNHKPVHVEETPWPCRFCAISFRTKVRRAIHESRAHRERFADTKQREQLGWCCFCLVCKKGCGAFDYFREHVENEHPEIQQPEDVLHLAVPTNHVELKFVHIYFCSLCGKGFDGWSDFRQHVGGIHPEVQQPEDVSHLAVAHSHNIARRKQHSAILSKPRRLAQQASEPTVNETLSRSVLDMLRWIHQSQDGHGGVEEPPHRNAEVFPLRSFLQAARLYFPPGKQSNTTRGLLRMRMSFPKYPNRTPRSLIGSIRQIYNWRIGKHSPQSAVKTQYAMNETTQTTKKKQKRNAESDRVQSWLGDVGYGEF